MVKTTISVTVDSEIRDKAKRLIPNVSGYLNKCLINRVMVQESARGRELAEAKLELERKENEQTKRAMEISELQGIVIALESKIENEDTQQRLNIISQMRSVKMAGGESNFVN